jgi:flap endonuclease-1
MGVKLAKDIPKHETSIKDLSGGVYVVDAYNIIYQFLTTIRDRDSGEPFADSKGNITSHLSGLFYRNINYMKEGLKLIYIFDGAPPEMKTATREKRKEIKKKAMEKLEIAKNDGDFENVYKYSQQTVNITKEIVSEAKELLNAMGIQCYDAPSEGEAQAAVIARDVKGIDGVISQDLDCLLFGAPVVIRNISTSGRRKLPGKNIWVPVTPEKIVLSDVLDFYKINQDQLIMLGMLIGTDYNPDGVVGIGPSKGLKLIKEKGDFDSIFDSVEWREDYSAKEIFDILKKPSVNYDFKIDEPEFNKDKIFDLLVKRREFSQDRVNNGIKTLEEIKKKKAQRSLGNWM